MGLPELRSRGFETRVCELGVANARFKRSRVFPFRKDEMHKIMTVPYYTSPITTSTGRGLGIAWAHHTSSTNPRYV